MRWSEKEKKFLGRFLKGVLGKKVFLKENSVFEEKSVFERKEFLREKKHF
jgi:hypothetical protein